MATWIRKDGLAMLGEMVKLEEERYLHTIASHLRTAGVECEVSTTLGQTPHLLFVESHKGRVVKYHDFLVTSGGEEGGFMFNLVSGLDSGEPAYTPLPFERPVTAAFIILRHWMEERAS